MSLSTLLGQAGTGAPANSDFAARISGILNSSIADDGLRLRIGGADVMVDNTYHPEEVRFGSIALAPGSYAIDRVFFERLGEASLEFSVAQGDGPFDHVGAIGGPPTVVPEPAAYAMGGASLLVGFGIWRRLRTPRA